MEFQRVLGVITSGANPCFLLEWNELNSLTQSKVDLFKLFSYEIYTSILSTTILFKGRYTSDDTAFT